MEKSFLDEIISGALAAQDKLDSFTPLEATSEPFSAITEKDGYVGEMVKASLSFALFESAADYSRKFDESTIVIISSTEASANGSSFEFGDYTDSSIDSIQELLDLVSNELGIDVTENKDLKVFLDSSQKINIDIPNTEYGKINVKIGVSIYEEIKDKNSVLRLSKV